MFATIFKSPKAILAIVETLVKVRETNCTIVEIVNEEDYSTQKVLTDQVEKRIGELLMPI